MHSKRPAQIKTLRREFDFTRPALALALSAAISAPVLAAEPVGCSDEVALDTLVIEGKASQLSSRQQAEASPYASEAAPYKAERVQDSKHTRPIAETPQTMTVLTRDSIAESGKTELKDILAAQPGITLGTGEGGNSFGDRYIIRGYEARSDVFTDGMREPGLITRDTFALEQVEITKGPSSTFAGRGSTGGSVNSVTKKASLIEDFSTATVGAGTDGYRRTTLDSNLVATDRLALRANLMYGETDIADREPAREQRQGALLSGVFEASEDLKLSADYYYFRSDDVSDPGKALNRATGEIRDYQNVAQDGLDFQETGADIFTFAAEYAISDELRIENKTRVGSTENDYIISLYTTRNALRHRAFSGWQENDYRGNQTNLIWDTELAGLEHTLITGAEIAREETTAGNYTVKTTSSYVLNPYDPDNNAWQGGTRRNPPSTRVNLDTLSWYLMDTITLNEDWEVFAGVRMDSFDYQMDALTTGKESQYSDSYWNGHLGVVWSPWENGNIYATWSTATEINGGEADAAANCGYGGLCTDSNGNYAAAEPEESTNYEIGTKWNLFDEQLLLTLAAFQTTKDKVIEGGVNSYTTGGSLNTGSNRVHGIEFGLSGNLTDKLSGQFGAAIMNSETLKSYNPAMEGLPKANFAEKSANLQLRYQLTPKFAFGGTMTYSSEIYGGQPDAGATLAVNLPSYKVYDAFATYDINDELNLRANVQNLTNKEYYTALYRSGSIVYLGDARTANMTLTWKF